MPRENKKLKKLGISHARYLELKYFCRQYSEMRSELQSLTLLSSVSYDGVRSSNGGTSAPTEQRALKIIKLKDGIRAIESAAEETSKVICDQIILHVTEGIDYYYLDVPCGRNQFYKLIETFYINLDKKNRG